MTDFVTVLSNFGFPVALSLYLLFRFEKKIESLEKAIDELRELIKDLTRLQK